ncbi:unnamed protein product [Dibothriocephalus latus]|uniref:Uncharacterized protein n=1 Tax=Dibothriocephalus latus TaxID=60516 RepID=A0A3P7LA87_DIBLA|nr:unnamed protein product [Dibothriocephalus latus]
MAAYHRFKASQRQQTHLISGASNDSTSQKTLFRYVESGDRSSGGGKTTTDKGPILYSQDTTRRPQFSFGSPSTSTDRQASSSPPVIISHIKATPFKFGAPAVPQTTASAVPNFSFGADSASTASSVTSQSPAFSFSAFPTTSTPVLNKPITESKSGNPIVSASANFTLGFKSANFSVVKPSTSLAYGLSPKPVDSAVNTSAGSASNGTQPALPASNSLFGQIKFGSTSSAPASNLNGIPSTSNSANSVAPTFVFGATMKENVTPPIGLNSQTGTLFAKPPSAASTPATNQPTAPFKFGDANQPAAPFKFGDANQPAPFKSGDANQPAPFLFNASSNRSTGGAVFSNPPEPCLIEPCYIFYPWKKTVGEIVPPDCCFKILLDNCSPTLVLYGLGGLPDFGVALIGF